MMNNEHLILNANPIVVALQKPSADVTKADIIDYIVKNDIENDEGWQESDAESHPNDLRRKGWCALRECS